MKSINHRNIRLIREDLTAYDTIIDCELPLPKHLLDVDGGVFLKNRTVFESGQSRVVYSQLVVHYLPLMEIVTPPVDAKSSAVK